MDTTKTDQRVAIEVSDDRLQAWIIPVDSDDPRPLAEEDIVHPLKEAKIVVGEHVRKRIDEFLDLAGNIENRPKRFLIAKGRSVVEGTNGTFKHDESLQRREEDWQGDTPVNYYAYKSIHMVQKDDPIGTLVSAVPGVEGVDVFGEVLKPARQPKEVELDATVRRSEADPKIVFADVSGQVDYSKRILSIKEVFIVAKDVDFGTGNIDSPVDVQIRGTVHDGFIVKSQRAITIGGAIESAEVEAKGDIVVRGGILQKGKSSVTSGRDIVARFCDEADLRAGNDVKICKELMGSHVHCDGRLLAAHGAIIGGSVYAREGIDVGVLGSDANVKTELIVGIHPGVIDEADDIRESLKPKREAAERIRCAVKPLLAELKRLSPAQKEKATELMFEAHAMDAEVAEAEEKCSTMLKDARARGIPYVLVSKIILPGVSVRIGRRITSFQKAMHGPLKIEKRKVEEVTEFVAINQLTGSITLLPSSYIERQPREEPAALTDSKGGEGHGSSR
ncbi:MAG: DUF342 domain-containing protein [Planctomycetes bacterium]|nr:DUF342 domain-containing protein [Planctomycetota bacterium]